MSDREPSQADILAHREYVASVLADPRPGELPAPFDEWAATCATRDY